MNCLTLSSRSCEFTSFFGVVFQSEYATKSVFLCVIRRTKFPTCCYSYQPKTCCIELQHFNGSLYWGRKTYEVKSDFSRNGACMKRALLHMKEGDTLWTLYPFACGALIPSYCCSPTLLCRLFKQLLCWAPWNESIGRHICSSPGDAEQRCASSVQLAERKQFISLFYATVNMFLLQSWVCVGTLRLLIYMKFLVCVEL